MPWELGFFDAHNWNVAILPIISDNDGDTFKGQEYLILYPYVDVAGIEGQTGRAAWVNKSACEYLAFNRWKRGTRIWKRMS